MGSGHICPRTSDFFLKAPLFPRLNLLTVIQTSQQLNNWLVFVQLPCHKYAGDVPVGNDRYRELSIFCPFLVPFCVLAGVLYQRPIG